MEQTQTTTTNNDPLAQFMPQAQAEPQKIAFAGQEFDSLEAAQQWSAQKWEQQEREKQRLEAELRALQAQRQQPAATQYATGREGVTYDHDRALRELATSPDGLKYMLTYGLTGNPNGPDAFELMKASIAETARLRSQMEMLTLQSSHPEIDWRDPRQVDMIRQAMPIANGSAEGAIAILQRDGNLPTRQQWQAQFTQRPVAQGNTVQQQPNFQANGQTVAPPMMGRTGGGAPSSGLDIQGILAKMEDPNTPVEESARLHQALLQYANENPTAGGL